MTAKGLYVQITVPKSMFLTEFTEASEELAYELCSSGRCNKCLGDLEGARRAMREEQKEAQDKMSGKEGSLRRVREMFQEDKGEAGGQKKRANTAWWLPRWACAHILFVRQEG